MNNNINNNSMQNNIGQKNINNQNINVQNQPNNNGFLPNTYMNTQLNNQNNNINQQPDNMTSTQVPQEQPMIQTPMPQENIQPSNINPIIEQPNQSLQNNNINKQPDNISSTQVPQEQPMIQTPMLQENIQPSNINPIIEQPNQSLQNNNINKQPDNISSTQVPQEQPMIQTPMPQENIQPSNINPIIEQPNQSLQNNNINKQPDNILSTQVPQEQPTTILKPTDDEELLRAFIGNNYDKITTKQFNLSGFFFSTFYMFYRKMFLYAIALFFVNVIVLNVIDNILISLLFNVLVGIFVNKIYLSYAKNKINKIKLKNPQSDQNELKSICSTKGGTSIGQIFLGLLAELATILVVTIILFIAGFSSIIGTIFEQNENNIKNETNDNNNGFDVENDEFDVSINENEPTEESKNENNNQTTNKPNNNYNNSMTLIEDVKITGYGCFDSTCNITVDKSNNTTTYTYKANHIELFKVLNDYDDYVRVDIYYTQEGNEKLIVDYKLFIKSNNEDISNVSTESELRKKIGLYSEGTHTATMTLTEIGIPGFGISGDESYTYSNFTFKDNKNIEYEMQYMNPNNDLNLVKGNTYNVTFEVTKGTFDYEYNIKSIN